MKKSLLALALIAFASSSSAATVYDKDGTSLSVGGRVQSVLYNGKFNKAGDRDASNVNSARLNIGGETRLTDYVSAFAFAEWNMADGAAYGNETDPRDQYVGLDFHEYGKVVAGRQLDAFYEVQYATDVFEDTACVATYTNGDRRNGQIAYTYDNYGFFAKLAVQSAADNVALSAVEGGRVNVNGGFSGALGYTFDNVVFGPLSFKAGYSYLQGQNDKGYKTLIEGDDNLYSLKNFKEAGASITWGSTDSGLYLAALYQQNRFNLDSENESTVGMEQKDEGFELVAGYNFDNGVGVYAGYEALFQKAKNKGESYGDTEITRRVPVFVNYTINANFNIWTEAQFDAKSSKDEDRGSLLSVGARYTF